jgi:nucleotide-binding universal stress UspA family protein
MRPNILVAVDGSARSLDAVRTAAAIAEGSRAHLTILTAVRAGKAGFGGLDLSSVRPSAARQGRDALHEAASVIPEGLLATVRIERGAPVRVILDHVRGGGYDLLVVGSRGRGPLRSALLGSVSRPVIERSPIPVLVAHGRPRRQFRRCLVAVDGSRASLDALLAALRLAPPGVVFTVLGVNVGRWATAPADPATIDVCVPKWDAQTMRILEDAEAAVNAFRAVERLCVVSPSATRGIVDTARQRRPDLVVVGSRGLGVVRRALLGSVAHGVVDRLDDIPVMVVHQSEQAVRIEAVGVAVQWEGDVTTEAVQ